MPDSALIDDNLSMLDRLALLPLEVRQEWLDSLSPRALKDIIYDWSFLARRNQLEPPGDWYTWLILAGRGFGKTRTGAEWVRGQVEREAMGRVALVGRTAADVRDVMVEGESGILAVSNPRFRPIYKPSVRKLIWPNGAIATTYSGDEPDQLRGPQHDGAWADELAAWKYEDAWDQLQFGLRLGTQPRVVVTTTPRATTLIKGLMWSDLSKKIPNSKTHVTTGSTYENKANLAPQFIHKIIGKYEGTRLGDQEIYARILEAPEGALFTQDRLDAHRVVEAPKELAVVAIGVDPATTSNVKSNETGIIVAARGKDRHGYVLEDLSGTYSPEGWAVSVARACLKYKRLRLNVVVTAEVNQGGDMVETILKSLERNTDFPEFRGLNMRVHKVRASKGKFARAEPIANLEEQHKIHNVGVFAELEDQLMSWTPNEDYSPDRLDAYVWAFYELLMDDDVSRLGKLGLTHPSLWGVAR